jgi:hypothetical protein
MQRHVKIKRFQGPLMRRTRQSDPRRRQFRDPQAGKLRESATFLSFFQFT